MKKGVNKKTYIIAVEDLSINPNQLNLLNYIKRVFNPNDEVDIVEIQSKGAGLSSISGEWMNICEKENWQCNFMRINNNDYDLISKNLCIMARNKQSKSIIYHQRKKTYFEEMFDGHIPKNLINKCHNRNVIIIKEK
eukprot:TRINITY_DN11509_c0_g1_i1.p1 TRINITY_DN11509_c0_g1~~TRINITY_DN11509_c0_g1_i1.p1  ORF type:complete len:137 (+),score=17.06 TRINITY_DN11509_c0_g1_i1:152-562(+)